MKRLLLSLLPLCLAMTAMAEPIGKQAALFTAQSYMLAKGKTISNADSPVRSARKANAQAAGDAEAYYYVFNAGNDGGYVIVSGDDRTEPILGYVEHGTFDPDNIPENMRSWLQLYADQIKYIVDNNIGPNSPLLRKRNKVRGTKHSVPELLTTRWNQGSPYNITCPKYYKKEDGTQHYPATGCTATAMAQVMYFYKFPEKTKAVIPAHSVEYTLDSGEKKTSTAKAVPRNTRIDWENMRDTYNWQDLAHANKQDTAVANLMLYCGQSVHMGWGPSSGANFSAEAYIKYFGYDNSCYVGERYDYSIDDWFDMLYNEIEQGYPVLFSGFSSGGGHAFVLDGFDGENLFHLNWGWGGGSNGWFLVGILNPGDNSGIGASSSSDGYSMSQRALFNLRLPDNNNADTYLFIKDVSATGSNIKATFENRTGATGSFNIAIVMQDDNGELSVVGNQQMITGMAAGSTQTRTFNLKGKLTEGTYRLSPASKATRNTVWRPKFNLYNHYIEAVVDAEGEITLNPVDISNGNSISIDTIVFPGTRIVGKEQEVRVTYRNNSNEYFREVRFFASVTQKKIYTESRSIVAVRKGETIEVSYFFTPDTTGVYNLWFCTGSDGSGVVGTGTMEIVDDAHGAKSNLSVNSYTITNASNGVAYGKRLVGKATIKNNARVAFNGNIRLQVWRQPNGQGSAWSGSSKTYYLEIAPSRVATIDFDFDGLNEGDKYYLAASYVNQDGSLGNGGVWDLGGWDMRSGVLTWRNNGLIIGAAYRTTVTAATTICGLYADCNKINRLMPNKNPNTIYAFAPGMEVPVNIDSLNVVSGNHAPHINMVNDKPYYVPRSFETDSASFTYTFPETEKGTGWHTFTMPFEVDSIFVDSIPVMLDDSLKHFWIYEFTAQKNNGGLGFAPATILRGNTPYIIAADSTMAGRSIVFRSLDVPFYQTGSDKMVVTSHNYQFHGTTLAPSVKDCYILNEDGTAFEYISINHTITGLTSYITTNLPEEERLPSIVLPDIPEVPPYNLILDETVSAPVIADTYDQLILKRTFEAGLNSVCLPFDIDDVPTFFGQGTRAYAFIGFEDNELQLAEVNTLAAGQPYILNLPAAITETMVMPGVTVEEEKTEAGFVSWNNTYFRGTYAPVAANERTTENYFALTADGKLAGISAEDNILGFRAWFELPEEAIESMQEDPESITVRFIEDATALKNLKELNGANGLIFNLAGQRTLKAQKGINIIGTKKILIK